MSKSTKPAAASGNQALTKAEEKALAEMWDGADESGFEETTSEDYAVPFIQLLQKNSPQCDEDSGGFTEGARPGMFLDTSTGELLESIEVIPCYYRRSMVEWKDRDEGGGFVAQHEVGAEEGLARDDRGRFITDQGTYLSDTRYFFCLRRDPDTNDLSPVVVSMASTQIKKARAWLTKMQNIRATASNGRRFTLPMFANIWKISSVGESNDKGTWKGYKIELIGPIHDPETARAAKDAREMFKRASDLIKPPSEDGSPAREAEEDGDPAF